MNHASTPAADQRIASSSSSPEVPVRHLSHREVELPMLSSPSATTPATGMPPPSAGAAVSSPLLSVEQPESPTSSIRAISTSRELTVVPFAYSGHSYLGSTAGGSPGHQRSTQHTHALSPHIDSSAGHNGGAGAVIGGGGSGYYPVGLTAYGGELAPMTVSTERVCPHCLRPYDLYDEEMLEDLYARGRGDVFFRAGDSRSLGARGLPAPPSRSASSPAAAPHSPPVGAASAPAAMYLTDAQGRTTVHGMDGATVASVRCRGVDLTGGSGSIAPDPHAGEELSTVASRASNQRGSPTGSAGSYGGAPFPPPAVAFTAHYFRALPPPAMIASAVASGAAPLAIEDYHPDLRNEQETIEFDEDGRALPQQERVYASVGAGYSGKYSGALVPAPISSSGGSGGAPYGYVSPTMHIERGRPPLQLTPPDGTIFSSRARAERIDNEEEAEEGDAETELDLPGEGSTSTPAYSPNAPGPAPNNGYYKQYFKELRQLGRGTYGGVYLCRHLMCGVNLGDFALKKIPVGDRAGYLQSVLREVRILEEVRRHPNVVEYKHSWVEDAQLADFGPPVRCLFILMEYASAGSLDAYLEKYGTNLSTPAVWYFFLSAAAGTAHLHQKHILHRDLKPQNLLLAEARGRPPRVLVSDFGTATLLDDITYERSGGTGTLEYMAPELFETTASPRGTNEHYVNHHTPASDVWSLGMILYYLAFDASLPERREDGSAIVNSPRCASYVRPAEMVRLMEAMLQLDPGQRPSCADILGYPQVQSLLRAFHQDDLSQWDLHTPQHGEKTHKKAGGTAASPRQEHFSTKQQQTSRDHSRRPASGNMITVTSTSSPSILRSRDGGESEGNDSGHYEAEHLRSSRVELISTTNMMDLSDLRPGSGSNNAATDGQQQQQQLHHSRHRPPRVFSAAQLKRHSENPLGYVHPSPSGSVASPFESPPRRRTVDTAVQTDPVTILPS